MRGKYGDTVSQFERAELKYLQNLQELDGKLKGKVRDNYVRTMKPELPKMIEDQEAIIKVPFVRRLAADDDSTVKKSQTDTQISDKRSVSGMKPSMKLSMNRVLSSGIKTGRLKSTMSQLGSAQPPKQSKQSERGSARRSGHSSPGPSHTDIDEQLALRAKNAALALTEAEATQVHDEIASREREVEYLEYQLQAEKGKALAIEGVYQEAA